MSQNDAKQKSELLKRLREQHAASVEATQALLKDLQAVRKSIRQAMRAGPKTVPELAMDTQMPAHEVLWHVIAMKKYGLVAEAGLSEGYYKYRLPEEAEK